MSLLEGFMGIAQASVQASEDKWAQKRAMEYNAEQSQIARDFGERMSSSAYQRSTQDMVKAGLNPMMMYAGGGKGGAAGTPNSAQGSVSAFKTDYSAMGRGISSAVGHGLQAARLKKDTGIASEQIKGMKFQNQMLSNQAATSALREKYNQERLKVDLTLVPEDSYSARTKSGILSKILAGSKIGAQQIGEFYDKHKNKVSNLFKRKLK